MKNIYVRLFDLLGKKEPLVLATIIETRGSTPQVPGASALFSYNDLLDGTLGGGILEADAQKMATRSIKNRNSLLYEFRLKADISSEEGAICGGEVKILLDASPKEHRDTFKTLSQSLIQRKPGILATFVNRLSDEKASILRYWIEKKGGSVDKREKQLSFFQSEIKNVFSKENTRLVKVKENIFPEKGKEILLFLEPILPLPQLVIAGAGHIGKAVAHLGNLLDFEVTVMDDRPEFANKERLPDAHQIIVGDIGRAINKFPVSSDTYFVIVTRGHHHDAEALRHCIDSDAAYIGMIGSIRKIELMRKKFLEERWATPSQLDRVYAPIGVEIGSNTIEEIAISIAAQLVLVRSQIKDKKEEIK